MKNGNFVKYISDSICCLSCGVIIPLFWLAGCQPTTVQLESAPGLSGLPIETPQINIGQNNATGGNDWEGEIGGVHIYNRILSANEVLHNYNALKGRFE